MTQSLLLPNWAASNFAPQKLDINSFSNTANFFNPVASFVLVNKINGKREEKWQQPPQQKVDSTPESWLEEFSVLKHSGIIYVSGWMVRSVGGLIFGWHVLEMMATMFAAWNLFTILLMIISCFRKRLLMPALAPGSSRRQYSNVAHVVTKLHTFASNYAF